MGEKSARNTDAFGKTDLGITKWAPNIGSNYWGLRCSHSKATHYVILKPRASARAGKYYCCNDDNYFNHSTTSLFFFFCAIVLYIGNRYALLKQFTMTCKIFYISGSKYCQNFFKMFWEVMNIDWREATTFTGRHIGWKKQKPWFMVNRFEFDLFCMQSLRFDGVWLKNNISYRLKV